eukprot:g11467.t1
MLSRMEVEAEHEQEALRLRIDEETAELRATMSFSRASVVASVEQERELRKARKAEAVRLRLQQEAGPSPNTELARPSCLPLSLPEPELAREDAEDSLRLLLDENRRLKDENSGLSSEVSSLRAQVEALSAAPIAAAATSSGTSSTPEEEISGAAMVSVGGGEPTSRGLDAIGDVVAGATASAEGGKEDEESGQVAGKGGLAPAGRAENVEVLALALIAPPSSPRHGERQFSPATATDRAQFWGADGAFGDDACSKTTGSTDSDREGKHEKGGRESEEEGDMRHHEKADIDRVIEEEAERVYVELRANPPPEIKALLAARQEMDKASATAR